MDFSKFPPVQRKMLEVLADGMPHTKEELHACLWDEQGPLSNIRAHICIIRKSLQPIGQDIVCEIRRNRKTYYRQVRLLASACNGYR